MLTDGGESSSKRLLTDFTPPSAPHPTYPALIIDPVSCIVWKLSLVRPRSKLCLNQGHMGC